MPITAKIREQIISTFRAEMAEHIQAITDGLLALEKRQQAPEERQNTLQTVFRAAHSLKGAARAVGVTAIEQLGHALESVLSDMQRGVLTPTVQIYTSCYHALEAIQSVELAYEGGATTPPTKALQALTELETIHQSSKVQTQSQQETTQKTEKPEKIEKKETNDAQTIKQTVSAKTRSISMAQSLASDLQGSPPDPIQPQPIQPQPIEEPAVQREITPTQVEEEVETPAAVQTIAGETIRVRVEKLDSVINQLSELLMAKIHLEQRQVQISQLQAMVAEWQKGWHAAQTQYTQKKHSHVRVEKSNGSNGQNVDEILWTALQPSQTMMKDISNKLNSLSREYSNDTVQVSLVIDALEQEVKQIRMLPLSTITATFGLMMRNLAESAGKEIDFQIIGGDVEMDKRVLELVKDPLIHILRNALDHGIESTEERRRLGKSPCGKITLRAEHQGKDVVLRIEDDGGGLHMDSIRKAVARVSGQDAKSMTDHELTSWIFSAGISTSPMVTDVSGRGIGLDVVRRNVEALQGRIDVTSTQDVGTTFTLTIPMALTSSHVLLVKAAGQKFALPLSSIERIVTIKPGEVAMVGGQEVFQYNGRPMPVTKLKTIFALPEAEEKGGENQKRLAIIVGAADRRMALIVDELLSEQEIVIKGLGKQLARVGGIAGATVLGNGQVVLVINTGDIIKLAAHTNHRTTSYHPVALSGNGKKKEISRKRVLIVDDSITTRTLEKHILEAEGYLIEVATDGQQALSTIATSGIPDLVISDINMPRIDGFELTSRLKSDTRTNGIPVILVSSLDSAEDKAHGVQVGADAYIVKSRFDQGNLLDIIHQLIG